MKCILVLQAEDYYPFGLAFNSYQRENSTQQNYLFNGGSELQRSLDLGWYQTLFRTYDPAIGRFLQIDPLADFFSGITPYNFAENNPILYGDPTGLSPNIWQRIKAFFGVGRLSGSRAAGNQEYVKPVARNNGEKKPYHFALNDYSQKPKPPTNQGQSTQTVAHEETEEEEEPSVTYIPPGPILKPRPPKPKPVDLVITKQPDPRPRPPFDVPRGGTHQFDAYQFEPDKSDPYRTPLNDKLINDLIITLKSSSSIHLEIKGNINAEPDNAVEEFLYPGRQQKLMSGRAQAIYDALRAAGIPASQLKASTGNVGRTGGNMSATFILKNR